MKQVFPEFLDVIKPHTKTAMFLLKKYLMPEEFLNIEILENAKNIMKISHNQHGHKTLLKLKEAASKSIGINLNDKQYNA